KCSRDLETVFGNVTIRRKGYSKPGSESLYPLDAELNLPTNKYSDGLTLRTVEESAKISFDEAVASVGKSTGGKVPKRQAQGLTEKFSQDFEEYYQRDKGKDREQTTDPLIVSLDGKG